MRGPCGQSRTTRPWKKTDLSRRGRSLNNDTEDEGARPAEGERATDDLCGELVGASEVRAALKGEPEFMTEIELCEDSTAERCWASNGKKPVSTKWTHFKWREKGLRSRLVARDFKANRTRLTCSHPRRRWT